MTGTSPDTGVGGATSPAKAQFIASAASRAYQGPSVVDFLNLSGYDSSPASRTSLAGSYGIQGYNTGSNNADLNTSLLSALRSGQPGGTTPTGGSQAPGGTNNADPNTGNPAPSAADTAYAAYLASLTDSPDVTSAKTYLNDLVSKDKLAREKALYSGETMGFAGGEAARVGRNNALTIDAYSKNLDTLTNAQTRTQDVSKAKYEYLANKEKEAKADAKTKAEQERLANPAFELSAGQKRYVYDLKAGTYKEVASVAPKPVAPRTTPTPEQKKALDTDVQNSVVQFQNIMKAKGWRGVNPDDYAEIAAYFQKQYGTSGVSKLKTAMNAVGLKVDTRK